MKYIVCNLKKSLNDSNVNKYIETIKNNKYENLIICPDKKYINYFKGNYKVGTQDYYENIDVEYTIIAHYDTNDSKEDINKKIKSALKKNIKIILCIGNNNFDDLDNLKKQLDEYLKDIQNINNMVIAYEPFFMIDSNKEIDLFKITKNINYIKEYFDNNIKVLYGGNVNEENIEKILKISDGVLMARTSYSALKLTKLLNKIVKNI